MTEAKRSLPRLPEACYVGRVAVAFTACLSPRRPYFVDHAAVQPHIDLLAEEVERTQCIAYAYCFMPDHLHVLMVGPRDDSQPLLAMRRFKQRSGFALRKTAVYWQPRFYDHILRPGDDTVRQAMYILHNPVRAGLCDDPWTYPYAGMIGISRDDLLVSVIDL